jgi:hypothetical protein
VASGDDGVVTYQSAHIPEAASELVARSGHSMQDNPQTVSEVRRIPLLHLAESGPQGCTPATTTSTAISVGALVFDMARVMHPGLPLDIPVLFSRYLPNYAYDLGATETSKSFDALRHLSKIHDKAVQADADPSFSARIREGVPVPR